MNIKPYLSQLAVQIDYNVTSGLTYHNCYLITQSVDIMERIETDQITLKEFNEIKESNATDDKTVVAWDLVNNRSITLHIDKMSGFSFPVYEEAVLGVSLTATDMRDVAAFEDPDLDDNYKDDFQLHVPDTFVTPEMIINNSKWSIDYDDYITYLSKHIESFETELEDGEVLYIDKIDQGVLNLFNVTQREYADNLFDPESSSVDMEKCRDIWLDKIRYYRESALKILDKEEKMSEKDNDTEAVEEIDIVKQMLRDVPQDTDLSRYTTIKDLISFWPPLLLPIPPFRKLFDITTKPKKTTKKSVEWAPFGEQSDEYYNNKE